MRHGTLVGALLLLHAAAVGAAEKKTVVNIETELGGVLVEVDEGSAPITAANFLRYVEKGLYDNVSFYRVVRLDNDPQKEVKIEVIQGGRYKEGANNVIAPIPHETTETTGIRHLDGVISMARLEPGTASSEFFICIGDQPSLDYGGNRNPDGQGFAAFGRVISGMDIVRQIQKLPDQDQILVAPVLIRRTVKVEEEAAGSEGEPAKKRG
jgi:peptidyl-prolyl cis-trans isomerase A (cyclophilin A)